MGTNVNAVDGFHSGVATVVAPRPIDGHPAHTTVDRGPRTFCSFCRRKRLLLSD